MSDMPWKYTPSTSAALSVACSASVYVEEAEAGVELRIVVGAHELHLVELGREPNDPIPNDDKV